MSETVIKVEGLGKRYKLGEIISTRTVGEYFAKVGQKLLGRFKGNGADPDEFWALKDVSFEVKRGEVLGVIGRNGAGKSTLLKILSRITDPTEGYAEITGRVGSLLEVGTGFHPDLTGRENVYMNGTILGMTKREIDRKFDEIVDFAGVEKFIDTPVKRYSSGMKTRLGFAVAAHLEPEILIVDEVLAVGDAEFQKKCLGKMKDVATGGRTVLFVSHNMAAVENLCTCGLLLDHGRATKQPTEECIASYLRRRSDAATLSLEDREDRTGSGIARFCSATIVDDDHNPIVAWRVGSNAHLHMRIANQTDQPLERVHLAIGIDDARRNRIAHLSTAASEGRFLTLGTDTSVVSLTIPELPLAPGTYFLTLFCAVNGKVADRIEDACTVEVAPADFHGTGRLPPASGQGVVLLKHFFSMA
jgi:lipopolysaccharide transport system ATP-binding protein